MLAIKKVSSANAFNFDKARILSSGKGLEYIMTFYNCIALLDVENRDNMENLRLLAILIVNFQLGKIRNFTDFFLFF